MDKLSNETFGEFGDFGSLTSDEVLQLVEPCLDTSGLIVLAFIIAKDSQAQQDTDGLPFT